MSKPSRNRHAVRKSGRRRNISIRTVDKSPPDYRKLSRAVVELARAQAEDTWYGAPGYLYGAAAGGPVVDNKLGLRVSIVDHRTGGWLDVYTPYTSGPSAGANIGTHNN